MKAQKGIAKSSESELRTQAAALKMPGKLVRRWRIPLEEVADGSRSGARDGRRVITFKMNPSVGGEKVVNRRERIS